MNRTGRALLVGAVLLARTAFAADPGSEVRAVGEAYIGLLTEDSLYLQLKNGLPVERLPDLSLTRVGERARKAGALASRLAAVPESGLAEEDLLSRAMLTRRLSFDRDAPASYWLGFEVTPYASPFGEVHAVLRALPLGTPAQADAFVALVGRYPAFVQQVRERLRGQADRGIRVPKEALPGVVAYLDGALAAGPQSPFAVADPRLTALGADGTASFRRALEPVAQKARAALQALRDDLGPAYAAAAPDAVGLSQYPGGRAAYEALVRFHTTLDVTPEAVHRIGVEEVERLSAAMAAVRQRLGFSGDAAAFRAAVKVDPRFLARTPDEVGARLMSHIARIEPKVEAFFLRRPKAPYGVKRLDAEREPGLTFGIYEPPSPGEPLGLYRFNGSKLEDRSLLVAAPLAFHELVPGHHFQIALQYENAALPRFRRELMDTAYTEGWGEYAAAVAEEMGMYADPYDLYGRLSMDMFLSMRLVVDTGMNALGWPRSKAMAFMREHLMESDTQIASESLRYSTDIPGQALGYKMGSRALWDLRRRAEAALGPRFDVRRFHDCVLGSGSLPLETLGRKLDLFIAKEKRP